MKPKTLDHVAVWVEDRDAVAAECERRYGMHVIDRNDKFTLVGVDARRGKLTLFEADGPREQGVLKHVALRASSAQDFEEVAPGLAVGVVEEPTDLDYDLDHVALYAADPQATEILRKLGKVDALREVEWGPGLRPTLDLGDPSP